MLVNVHHAPRIRKFIAYNPFLSQTEPPIPIEYAPYFELFEAIFEQARKDLMNADVSSPAFESAADWLTEGWYYQILEAFTDMTPRIKAFWQEVINRRRDEAETEGRDDRLAAVQPAGVCRESQTERTRI